MPGSAAWVKGPSRLTMDKKDSFIHFIHPNSIAELEPIPKRKLNIDANDHIGLISGSILGGLLISLLKRVQPETVCFVSGRPTLRKKSAYMNIT